MNYASVVRSGLLFVVFLSGVCAAARSSTRSTGPLADTSAGGPSSSIADAGAMRACMHDAKDLAPCTEDCDRGIAFACTLIAGRAERGDGVPKDLTRVAHLYERACELRDVASCITAARMHASGSGVPPSRARQVDWLERACALGDGTACVIAAKAFDGGAGVPHDERRADELWRKACVAGVTSACEAADGEP